MGLWHTPGTDVAGVDVGPATCGDRGYGVGWCAGLAEAHPSTPHRRAAVTVAYTGLRAATTGEATWLRQQRWRTSSTATMRASPSPTAKSASTWSRPSSATDCARTSGFCA